MPRYKFDQIAINSTEKKKPVEEDKYTYLGLEHLDSGSLHVTRFGADVAPIGEKLVMRKGDVLFGKRRAYQKKVAIAPFDGIFSAHGMVLRPRSEVICERLFPFFIKSNYFLDEAIKISVGSLSPTINWRDLKELEFNIPPINDQDALAEKLWAMEDAKQAYNRLLLATDALVKSQFIEMFGSPETNQKGWMVQKLGDLFRVRSSKRIYQRDQTSIGVPFLRVADLVQRIKNDIDSCSLFISEDQYNSFVAGNLVPKPQDILVTSRGTLGLCYIVRKSDKFYFQDGMISWLEKGMAKIDSVYISYLFSMDGLRRQIDEVSVGTTVNYLSLENLENLEIMCPDFKCQQQFSALVQQVDKSKFTIAQKAVKKI